MKYTNAWGDVLDVWFEVRRCRKNQDTITTTHNTLKEATKAHRQAQATKRYDCVYIAMMTEEGEIE